MEEEKPGLLVPARRIPPPPTISPEAQSFLAMPRSPMQEVPTDPNDVDAWRAHITLSNAVVDEFIAKGVALSAARVDTHRDLAAPLYELTPDKLNDAERNKAILFLHGGAYIYGAGLAAANMAIPLAAEAGLRTFSVDYRMPPEHPFPVGLDDALEAYRWLLGRHAPGDIAVAGMSAGGGLAAALLLKARDMGVPMPGACVLVTPEADLTESGDTFETNDTIDVVLRHRLTATIALYASGHDLRDPYLSPVFGRFEGFPPTILLSGTRDLFLSNTVLLHRAMLRAGVAAELHVWEAMPHGGFMGAPEDGEYLAEQVRFIRRQLRLV